MPMPIMEQGASGVPIAARREVVRFLSARQGIWHAAFPGLYRRAQPQIITHLGTKARNGATVGELHGLVKQVFLLDDSTVKERIQEIARLGLVRLDPPVETLSTRSIVIPTAELLERFDGYVLGLGRELLMTAAAIDAAVCPVPLVGVTAVQRGLMLHALESYAEPWRAALEQFFAAQALSPARRVEAIRHLNAFSHWTLLHMAIEHRYGVSSVADGAEGLLADRMAATLLALTGQNFQTTRDHIGYLMEIGLLARQPGKALRVALAEPAAPYFDTALSAAAAALPALALSLAGSTPATKADAPAELLPRRGRPAAPGLLHELVIAIPGAPLRRLPIRREGLTIGRLPPCDVLLPGADVSRQHCRLDLDGARLHVTDLNSTNGTIVDGRLIAEPTVLRPGARVQIGACILTYETRPLPVTAPTDDPETAERTLRGLLIRNKIGNSAQ